MKNDSIIKKVIACFMTFIMVFGILNVINPKQVQAATYPLKVHYLDVKGDATLIKYTYNGQTHPHHYAQYTTEGLLWYGMRTYPES